MIDLNPENRPTIKEALQYFADEICPITIPKCILQFNALINLTSYWKPDMLIGAHYKHWIQIWKVLFGPKKEVPLLCQKLNAPILNKLILKPSFPMIPSKSWTKKIKERYLIRRRNGASVLLALKLNLVFAIKQIIMRVICMFVPKETLYKLKNRNND